MNEAKSRTVFEERDQLRRECTRLSDQCNWLERKLVAADNELEAARKEIETLKYRVTALSDISGENNLLRCQVEEKLETTLSLLTEEYAENARLCAALEAARKVADAAVAFIDVLDSFGKVKYARYFDAYNPAIDKLNAAVREYRKPMEDPIPPRVRRALKGLEELEKGELEC